MRLLAAWLVMVGFLLGVAGLSVYWGGILVHHGPAPAEVLYGWAAVWWLCLRLALGFMAVTVVAGILAALLSSGDR